MRRRKSSTRRRVDPWVGAWLRERREAASLSMEAVAVRLDRNASSVSRLETGDSAIAADDLPAILAAYGLTVTQFAAEAKRAAVA